MRACYAALDMQAALRRFAEDVQRSQGIRVAIRVGLNSGDVVVRAIGSDLHMDYTAVGQTTHLAARMEQLAHPGTTLLTADTLRLAEGYVEVKPLGPVPVKGLAAPVEIYEVVRAGPVRSRLHAAAARGLTTFVGRGRELEQLREALGHAASGHGQVVALVGEPGVGKSRLVWEVTHSHRVHGWLVFQAGSVSYGKATPYLPVVDLLKRYFGIEDRDNPRAVREKVTGKLLTPGPDAGSRPAGAPRLARCPDRGSILGRAGTTTASSADSPRGEAALAPRDPGPATPGDLRGSPLDRLRDTGAARRVRREPPNGAAVAPCELPARVPPPVGKPDLLHPAPAGPPFAGDPDELVSALLGSDAGVEPLKRRLIAQTEGNPFFLEESVQTLAETEVLVGERGAYRLARVLPANQVIPATVQAILAARIDRLAPGDKSLLQTASVIGKDVPFALLQGTAGLAEDELRSGIARLQAAEFLYETRLFPELEYTFKHALTHDVAYASLLQDRRRHLHGEILAAIERLNADRLVEHIDRLGHHALRAEQWETAADYLRQAGHKAVSRSAFQEAILAYDNALVAVERLPDTRVRQEQAIDLRLDLRVPLQSLLRTSRLLEGDRAAESIARSLGDERRLGRISSGLANTLWIFGDHAAAIVAALQALEIGQRLGDVAAHATAVLRLGRDSPHARRIRQGGGLPSARRAVDRRRVAARALRNVLDRIAGCAPLARPDARGVGRVL